MATNYPENLDSFTNPTASDPVTSPSHAGQHADANDAIEALQTKVGVDDSAVNTTIDYKLKEIDLGDTAVGETSTQTLTNKKLVDPEVDQSATTEDSKITATGVDTNVNLLIKGKGTGNVKLGNGNFTVPNATGNDGQVLTENGSGVLSWTDKADFSDQPSVDASAMFLTSEQDTPNLTLQVRKGGAYYGDGIVTYAGGNTGTFTAPTSDIRRDIISLNPSGTLVITTGEEGGDVPTTPARHMPIAQIYNRTGQTSIKEIDDSTNGYIEKDLRPFLVVPDWFLVETLSWTADGTNKDVTLPYTMSAVKLIISLVGSSTTSAIHLRVNDIDTASSYIGLNNNDTSSSLTEWQLLGRDGSANVGIKQGTAAIGEYIISGKGTNLSIGGMGGYQRAVSGGRWVIGGYQTASTSDLTKLNIIIVGEVTGEVRVLGRI